jgi:hypothetical protein
MTAFCAQQMSGVDVKRPCLGRDRDVAECGGKRR